MNSLPPFCHCADSLQSFPAENFWFGESLSHRFQASFDKSPLRVGRTHRFPPAPSGPLGLVSLQVLTPLWLLNGTQVHRDDGERNRTYLLAARVECEFISHYSDMVAWLIVDVWSKAYWQIIFRKSPRKWVCSGGVLFSQTRTSNKEVWSDFKSFVWENDTICFGVIFQGNEETLSLAVFKFLDISSRRGFFCFTQN